MSSQARATTAVGPQVSYYILIAKKIDWEPFTTATEITEALAQQQAWLASRFMPYRKDYKIGDRVVFYAAGKGLQHFTGVAVISGPVREMNNEERHVTERLGLEDFNFENAIPLQEVSLWDKPVPIKPLVEHLKFIKDKKNYGLHLRQAATRIGQEDYDLLVGYANGEA